ncbi:MAG TPA: arylesterase [Geminicoccaceae bacterium]|nr:arylesterase [Geminicoccaceae bacterium]
MANQMERIARVLKGILAALALLPAVPGHAAEPPATQCRIAVLGDSLTAAYGLDVVAGFPARLEQALRARGYDCAVLDAGVSGDTSAGGLARLDWMLADRPSHVILELGGNDGLRALPPEQMERNLDQIISRLEAEGIPVLLTGMLAPPNLGREYGAAFAAVFPRLAGKHGVPLFPFFLEGVAGDALLNQGDGIHPTAEGVGIIVEGILPTVTDWLDGTS